MAVTVREALKNVQKFIERDFPAEFWDIDEAENSWLFDYVGPPEGYPYDGPKLGFFPFWVYKDTGEVDTGTSFDGAGGFVRVVSRQQPIPDDEP